MPSGPKNRKAARKKKNKNKKIMKASISNPPAEEKVVAEAEAVSEMVKRDNEAIESSGSVVTEVDESGDVGESSYHVPAPIADLGEKFSHDLTVMANPVLSDCVAVVDQLSLESDPEALSMRSPVNPLHEHLNASSTILPTGAETCLNTYHSMESIFGEVVQNINAITCHHTFCTFEDSATEKTAADVKLFETVAADIVLCESVSNVFVSEMISVGDANTQLVSEIGSNENEANESSGFGDNQNTFQEVLTEASSNKTERNKTCESVVNDEVKLQESLIETSKKTEREPFESVDHQISLDKFVTGPTSYLTEKNELPILVNHVNFLQESLIKSTSKETEGNKGGHVDISSGHVDISSYDPTTMANLVESDVADGDHISPESFLEGVSVITSSTIKPAEKKVAADAECFESVSNASEYSVGDMLADAVSEMCLNGNGGSESNESDSQKFLIKTISNTDETNESSESVITDEVFLEENLVETTSKIAEAYNLSKFGHEKIVIEEPLVEPFINKTEIHKSLEFISDQNNLQESSTKPTLSTADITKFVETLSLEPTSTANQVLLNVTTGGQISLEHALGGRLSLEQQVHPLPEPLKRPQRNKKLPLRYKGYYLSPQVKLKRK